MMIRPRSVIASPARGPVARLMGGGAALALVFLLSGCFLVGGFTVPAQDVPAFMRPKAPDAAGPAKTAPQTAAQRSAQSPDYGRN